MFPGGLPRLSPAHYLANLEVILSLVFCPIPRQILREVFLTLPGEKNSYPKGGGMTRKKIRPTCGSHLWGVLSLLTPWQKKDASRKAPPVVQNHIPGTQIHSPENFRKFGNMLCLPWRKVYS